MTVNTIIRISYALIGYLLHHHKEESGSNASRYPTGNMRGQPSTVMAVPMLNISDYAVRLHTYTVVYGGRLDDSSVSPCEWLALTPVFLIAKACEPRLSPPVYWYSLQCILDVVSSSLIPCLNVN